LLPGRYIARKNCLYPLRRGSCRQHSQAERAGEEKTPYFCY
jgi:hypothetical protein